MDNLKIALSSITFLSLKEKILLLDNLDSLSNLALLSIEDISSIIGRKINKTAWNGREVFNRTVKGAGLMETQNIYMVSYEQDEYPAALREIKDPPLVLFYRGNLSCLYKKSVSVVGTRRICRETAEAAFNFSRNAALEGLTVISGLANGIDSFAHRGALASGVKQSTAAILPCGIDIIIPAGQKKLVAKIIQENGCIVSEYIPGTPAESWRFVQRNRLIAALSPSTVVIQAPVNSGALLTVNFAIDYNRDVFFHAAGFCEDAQRINNEEKIRKRGLIKSSSEQFVEDGAPVINDYKDFVSAVCEGPGTNVLRNKAQLELFQGI